MRQWAKLVKMGVNLDLPNNLVPADQWTYGESMLFQDGAAVPFRDLYNVWSSTTSDVNVASQACRQLIYCPNASLEPWWISVYGYAGSAVAPIILKHKGQATPGRTNITRAAWAAVNVTGPRNSCSGGVLNGTAVFNVGQTHYPEYYNTTAGGATTTALPGWTANDYCKAIRPYKYHLVAMNMKEGAGPTYYPDKLKWSSASTAGALPSTWAAAAGNEAGDAILSDTPGGIIDGLKLGESFMIYKDNATYRMTYVGGNEVMRIEGISRSSGCIGLNALTEVEGFHVVLTQGDVVLVSESGEIKSIADGQVRRYLFANLDQTNRGNCWVGYNKARKNVWIVFPNSLNNEPNQALVYDLPSGRWAYVPLPFQAGARGEGPASELTSKLPPDERLVMAKAQVGLASGVFYSLNDPAATAGTYNADDAAVGQTRFDFGQPDRFKTIYRARILGEFTSGEVVTVSVQPRVSQSSSAGTAVTGTFTAGTTEAVDLIATGRFFDIYLTITGSTTIATGKLYGVELEYELGGLH